MNIPMPDMLDCPNERCGGRAKLVLSKLIVYPTATEVVVEAEWACADCGILQRFSEAQLPEGRCAPGDTKAGTLCGRARNWGALIARDGGAVECKGCLRKLDSVKGGGT